jgi:hypothetical protein
MKRAMFAVAISLVLACSPSADEADTMSLSRVDTLKSATDTSIVGSTAGATTATPVRGAGSSQTTAATQAKTGTKAAPIDTTNIGRDRALPIDTKDPRRRLPTVDTTKRPPGGA